MNLEAKYLASRVSEFLGGEVESRATGDRITLLTPAEYPNCDAVGVHVERHPDGDFVVSDMAAADGHLAGYLSARSARTKAEAIAERFDVEFVRGSVLARTSDDSLPETCWRVAQASAAIAEAVSFLPAQSPPHQTFDDLVWDTLRRHDDRVEREKPLRGLSGHEHRASLFVPATEAVVEPITGRKSWDRATRVYAEFGDLRQVNGYRLVAVLDDRRGAFEQEKRLLSQVGQVASWTRSVDWLSTVLRR